MKEGLQTLRQKKVIVQSKVELIKFSHSMWTAILAHVTAASYYICE